MRPDELTFTPLGGVGEIGMIELGPDAILLALQPLGVQG